MKAIVAMMKYCRTTLKGGVYGVVRFPGNGALIICVEPLTLPGNPDLIVSFRYLFCSGLIAKVFKLIIKHQRFTVVVYKEHSAFTHLRKGLDDPDHRFRRFKSPDVNLDCLGPCAPGYFSLRSRSSRFFKKVDVPYPVYTLCRMVKPLHFHNRVQRYRFKYINQMQSLAFFEIADCCHYGLEWITARLYLGPDIQIHHAFL